jgi:hypothetical protein
MGHSFSALNIINPLQYGMPGNPTDHTCSTNQGIVKCLDNRATDILIVSQLINKFPALYRSTSLEEPETDEFGKSY